MAWCGRFRGPLRPRLGLSHIVDQTLILAHFPYCSPSNGAIGASLQIVKDDYGDATANGLCAIPGEAKGCRVSCPRLRQSGTLTIYVVRD